MEQLPSQPRFLVHVLAVSGGQLADVRSVLEDAGYRVESPGPPAVPLRVGALEVDATRHEIWVDGRLVACTATEFRLLERFAAHPGQVLSRGQLLEHVRGVGHRRDRRTVDSHVRNLRRKLGGCPAPRIVTVVGVGYKLIDPTGCHAVRSGMSAGRRPSSAPISASAP